MQKDTTTAYALSLLGWCGCCGIHRFYLDMIPSGIIWFLTGGLCGFGQCIDLFIMPSLVAEANARLQPAATTVVVTGPVTTIAQPAIMAQPQPVYVQPAQPGMVVMGTTSTGQVIMAPQGQVMQMQPQMMQVNTMTPQVPVNAFTPQNQVMMMGPTAQPQPTTNIYQTF